MIERSSPSMTLARCRRWVSMVAAAVLLLLDPWSCARAAEPAATSAPRDGESPETSNPDEATEDPGTASFAAQLETVVVTARRRPELQYETPVSVTTLDAETMRAAQVLSVDDLVGLVPDLSYYTTGTGQDGTPFIRGLGAFPSVFLDNGVGTYLDGVYLARAVGSVLDVVDFDQVEVLRGPQGTLFGKNTIGGAINVTTTKPPIGSKARPGCARAASARSTRARR